jgi:UDP-glucose 4-epimerase
MITLLEVIKQNNINRFIFSSSATVYDSTHLPPYVETDPTRTESPYGTTKLMGEYILKDLSRYDQLYSLSLRYFNPIGAHHSGLIGEDPEGKPNNLVPYIFKAVL